MLGNALLQVTPLYLCQVSQYSAFSQSIIQHIVDPLNTATIGDAAFAHFLMDIGEHVQREMA